MVFLLGWFTICWFASKVVVLVSLVAGKVVVKNL